MKIYIAFAALALVGAAAPVPASAQMMAGANKTVMVGGAPVTQEWASEIGADGFSEDALGAVAEARRLLGGHAHVDRRA